MGRTPVVLVFVTCLLLSSSSFSSDEINPCTSALLSKDDSLKRLVPIVEKFWNDETIAPFADSISNLKRIDEYEPFRFFVDSTEKEDELSIAVNTIASPNAIGSEWLRKWLGIKIVRLGPKATQGKKDFTLGKVITAIIKGIDQRKAINPNLKRVHISAPLLINLELAEMLERFGMRLTRKSGPTKSLEINLEYE